jgi:hypothetical protein
MTKSGKPKVQEYFLNHQESNSEHEIYKGKVRSKGKEKK